MELIRFCGFPEEYRPELGAVPYPTDSRITRRITFLSCLLYKGKTMIDNWSFHAMLTSWR